ncbi:uncharacterized protein UV8b_02793 [Ustilaginoidea virens]|uniref:Uncharacterized protein n=1 Tax=Ustilaginoidea virens TaxID=1159556 RepID=A0A8E5HNH1_USTVR|nr:uncharacterized protein UV8b_02793 [Ustilaginoidea virens]QUC18552.1 hypothetical protein UV8b_02793 [Ustilaginoidea virens]
MLSPFPLRPLGRGPWLLRAPRSVLRTPCSWSVLVPQASQPPTHPPPSSDAKPRLPRDSTFSEPSGGGDDVMPACVLRVLRSTM